jgi:type II secretory pathway pseudopilin PulG
MLENRWKLHSRGFTNFEVLMVMAIVLILIGVSSIAVVRMIDDAKERTALSQIAAVFRAARQAALTVNEERRVVLKVTYSGSASSLKEAYEDLPTLEFWVERKRRKNESWDVESNVSPPLDDIQRMPAGVFLVDVNGRSVIPANLTRAPSNKDGTRSYRSYIIFNSKGVATYFYRDDDGGVARAEPISGNLALHFMFGTTEIDFSEIESPPKNIEYLSFVEDKRQVALPAGELNALVSEIDRDIEFTGRTQAQTLYIIRLTGQSNIYDYGVYPPWPRSLLPEDFEEAG